MRTSRDLRVLGAAALIFILATPVHADEPTYVYETVIPGYYLSRVNGMAVDAEGNAYCIALWYQDHQHLDVLVFKLDSGGTPVWTVPIIGDELEHDYATDIVLDSENNVWITGRTSSESFPTVNALDETLTGFTDAFVMKLASEDGTILYSTYLGADYVDEGLAITISDAGEIYVVGSTGSTDFPTTEDAYQDHPSAPLYIYTDAFITKLSPSGDAILYSTYFGGFEDDRATEVALDGAGNIVFAGGTTADDFPLENPIDSPPNEVFLSKLSADGSTLLFSTYFGGEDPDGISGMVLDEHGFVYIAGSTQSVDLPTTSGAFQEDFVGAILACGNPPFTPLRNCEDTYAAKLGMEGSGVVFCTYLGGSSVDQCSDIALDSDGCIHLVGNTASFDFPGSSEVGCIFVSKLTPDGSDLVCTFTKQSSTPGAGHGITIGDEGDVYFAGAVNAPADIYVARTTGWRPFTDVGVDIVVDEGFLLGPSAPNPFTAATVLSYSLPGGSTSSARLSIYDVSGRRVRTLMEGEGGPGTHFVTWDGTDHTGRRVASGVYFYRLEWNGQSRIGRTVLVR